MALQKTLSTNFGVDGNYIKIENIEGDKTTLRINVVLYANQAARDNKLAALKSWHLEIPTPTGTGNDLMVDLYNHLKTLPEFSGAIDV